MNNSRSNDQVDTNNRSSNNNDNDDDDVVDSANTGDNNVVTVVVSTSCPPLRPPSITGRQQRPPGAYHVRGRAFGDRPVWTTTDSVEMPQQPPPRRIGSAFLQQQQERHQQQQQQPTSLRSLFQNEPDTVNHVDVESPMHQQQPSHDPFTVIDNASVYPVSPPLGSEFVVPIPENEGTKRKGPWYHHCRAALLILSLLLGTVAVLTLLMLMDQNNNNGSAGILQRGGRQRDDTNNNNNNNNNNNTTTGVSTACQWDVQQQEQEQNASSLDSDYPLPEQQCLCLGEVRYTSVPILGRYQELKGLLLPILGLLPTTTNDLVVHESSTTMTPCSSLDLALWWLAWDDTELTRSFSSLETRIVLALLYYEWTHDEKQTTNHHHNHNNNNNGTKDNDSWHGWLSRQDECTWSGLDCQHQSFLTSLRLPNNQLRGTIPTQIGLLTLLGKLHTLHTHYTDTHTQKLTGLISSHTRESQSFWKYPRGYHTHRDWTIKVPS